MGHDMCDLCESSFTKNVLKYMIAHNSRCSRLLVSTKIHMAAQHFDNKYAYWSTRAGAQPWGIDGDYVRAR